MNTSTVTPTVSDPGGYEISALKVGKSVNGFNGTVITVWDGIKSTLDKSTPPHPKLIKSSRVFCVTLSHGNSEILMFAFDEWADAFSRLQIQTEMSFRCHHYVVFANASIPGNSPTASGVCLVISDQTMTSLCEIKIFHKNLTPRNHITFVGSRLDMIKPIEYQVQRKRTMQEVEQPPLKAADAVTGFYVGQIGSAIPGRSLQSLTQCATGDVINTYAVVVHYSRPKLNKGNGHKYSATYHLIDSSTTVPIPLIFFSSMITDFPKVFAVGDVMRCHRLRVGEFNQRRQLTGSSHKSSIMVFHRLLDPVSGLSAHDIQKNDSTNSSDSNTRSSSSSEEESCLLLGSSLLCPGLLQKDWYISSTTKRCSFEASETEIISKIFTMGDLYLANNGPEDPTGTPATPHIDLNSLMVNRFPLLHAHGDTAAAAVDPSFKFDFVGLVLKRHSWNDDIEAVSGEKESSALLVWDGSTLGQSNSITPPIPRSLQAALHYCSSNAQGLPCILPSGLPDAPGELPGCSILIMIPPSISRSEVPMEQTVLHQHLQPGTWLRIRNAYSILPVEVINGRLQTNSRGSFLGTEETPLAIARSDTHVCVLRPYFREVKDVIQRLNQNVDGHDEDRNGCNQVASTSLVRPPQQRKYTSSLGHPYTPLALCLTTIAPSKFCVLAKIDSWWPYDVERFITINSDSKSTFMFALRISDDTDEHDVILVDDDAEEFLGCTVEQFTNDREVRHDVERRLSFQRRSQSTLDFYIKSYLQHIVQPSVRSNRNQKNYFTIVKRFRVFKTELPSIRDNEDC